MSLTYIKKEGPKQTPEGYHQWRSQALKAGWAQGAWGTEVRWAQGAWGTEVLQRGPGAEPRWGSGGGAPRS